MVIIKIVIWVNNFSYRLLGVLAIRANNGIHPKHEIIRYYDFFIKNIAPEYKVLDVGCGNGALAYHMALKCAKVTGIDISKKYLITAKQRFSRENIEYILGDITQYPFQEKYDAVSLSNVLEHIEKRTEFLLAVKKISPLLLIRVPLLNRDWSAMYKKNIGAEYRLDLTHYTEYTEESFEEEMRKAGLAIQSTYTRFGELFAVVVNAKS